MSYFMANDTLQFLIRGGGEYSARQSPPSLTVPPPLPVQEYYIAVNGQQQGAFDFNTIKVNIENGTIQGNTLIWKKGMANWGFISQLPEFSSFFNELPPKLPTM